MANLIETLPFEGLLPVFHGAVTADAAPMTRITSIAPYKGKNAPVSAACVDQLGMSLPEAGHWNGQGDARLAWAGLGQYFLFGAEPPSLDGAAITDQTDAWAGFTIIGSGSAQVLARLIPIDLRTDQFKIGHAARTQFGHMNCLLTHLAQDSYEVLVFRSMAVTAAHEIETAMKAVAARMA